MKTDRKNHWEKIYSKTSDEDFSWFQNHPAVSLELIDRAGSSVSDYIIDVGGGSSLLVDHLLASGYQHLSVLDISGKALDMARNRLGKGAEKVQWIESDVTSYESTKPYDLWHDRAVFHFLTESDDRRRYVEVLRKVLAPHGAVIIAAFDIGGPTMCSGLNIVQYDADKLSAELGDEFLLQEKIPEMHVTPSNTQQAFRYFRFIRQ
ncbi:MAG: class I SAM-dependent methyltransferase [Gammaproteobacteria bacterium]|nr:class I SAM-dependent methyltransferase [Gammaproteobacteria bacterium]